MIAVELVGAATTAAALAAVGGLVGFDRDGRTDATPAQVDAFDARGVDLIRAYQGSASWWAPPSSPPAFCDPAEKDARHDQRLLRQRDRLDRTAHPHVIHDATGLDLVAGVSRSAAGRTLAEVTGIVAPGQVCGTVTEALQAAPVDLLVDYTSATAVKGNVWTAVDAGVHVVVGSSGLAGGDYAELDEHARTRGSASSPPGTFCDGSSATPRGRHGRKPP
jgi:hypothetical protein